MMTPRWKKDFTKRKLLFFTGSEFFCHMAMESPEFPELDRISSLPDEIIARVLSFLPTMKHAFMTSILSRQWQYLYCLTDELDIEVTSKCTQEFVDRVMMLRGGAHLRKLCLKHHCSHYGIHGSPIVMDKNCIVALPSRAGSLCRLL